MLSWAPLISPVFNFSSGWDPPYQVPPESSGHPCSLQSSERIRPVFGIYTSLGFTFSILDFLTCEGEVRYFPFVRGLARYSILTSNSKPSYLSLPSAGVTGLCKHTWHNDLFEGRNRYPE